MIATIRFSSASMFGVEEGGISSVIIRETKVCTKDTGEPSSYKHPSKNRPAQLAISEI